MLIRYCAFLICTLLLLRAGAQNCGCEENLRFVMNKVQQNYAGYNDKVTAANQDSFRLFTDSLLGAAATADRQSFSSCERILNSYIRFFRDGHMYLYHDAPPAAINPDSIRSLFAHWQTVRYTEKSFAQYLTSRKKPMALEGTWVNDEGNYRVGILFSGGLYRGFIIRADSIYWMPGQVKFTLQPKGNQYGAVYYKKDHAADTIAIAPAGMPGKITIGSYGAWYKINSATGQPYEKVIPPNNDAVSIRRLSKSTNLLTIKSFDSRYIRDIDSTVAAADSLIGKTENLIIDVRGNGGGADAGYQSLKKYLYTGSYNIIGPDLYCSDDNINNFRGYAANTGFNAEDRAEFNRIADSMGRHIGSYWSPFAAYNEEKMDTVLPYPKKVVVLIDGHCGSTTEQFLIDPVKNSRKATVMGQHSAGILDYANMSFLPMPCTWYEIGYATSRSRRIALGQGIDNTGVMPDITLSDGITDWIKYAQEYVEK